MSQPKICLPTKRPPWEWALIITSFLAASLTILTQLFGIKIGSLSAGIPSRTETGSMTFQGFYLFFIAGLLLAVVIYAYNLKRKGRG